jgi:hypothetical protein
MVDLFSVRAQENWRHLRVRIAFLPLPLLPSQHFAMQPVRALSYTVAREICAFASLQQNDSPVFEIQFLSELLSQ